MLISKNNILFKIPIIFMIIFFVLPLSLTVVWSVFERTMFWMEPGFTLFSYENFFFSARLENFVVSMLHSSVSVFFSFLIRRRVKKIAQHRVMLLFILPFMVSEIIRIFALRPILSRNGVLNDLLINFGFIDSPISAFVFTPTGVVIGEIVSFLPFMIFSTFLALEAIPNYIFEVCSDLGVNRRRMFTDIYLPLAAPGLFAGSVFIFVNGIGIALIPTILGGPGSVNAGLIATQAIIALDFPLAMAVSAIMMFTLMGLLYIGHRLFNLTKLLEPIS